MKLLVNLNKKNILDYLGYTNSFIIGLKDFSINSLELAKEEIKNLLEEYPNIELFVSINKNIFNSDLELLEENLLYLNNLNIKGVLFYDLAIVSLKKRLNLNYDLVWASDHLVTNYNTCNYYLEKGCSYAYISSDITVSEIKEIHDKSTIKLISLVFGHPMVSFSKRKLLSNYFTYSELDNDNNDYYEINSGNSENYLIKETDKGTSISYGKVLNGIKPMSKLLDTLEYGVLDENYVSHELFINVLKIYKDFIDNKISIDEANDKIISLTGSSDTLFYYRKTIYRVKDEKKN